MLNIEVRSIPIIIQNSMFLGQYSDELVLVGILNQSDNTAGIGFAKDVFAVGFNSTFAQEQTFGYLLIT